MTIVKQKIFTWYKAFVVLASYVYLAKSEQMMYDYLKFNNDNNYNNNNNNNP